jgi:hypothetical protein
MRILFLLIMFAFTSSMYAQSGVIVNQDPRFAELSEKQAEINKRASKYGGSGVRRGYRIQVINTQNRDEANAVKAEMLRRFPDQKAYMMYQAPNFRVRIGNFLTQKDASTLRKMIATLYPNRGIYVISDMIEYRPAMDEEDL